MAQARMNAGAPRSEVASRYALKNKEEAWAESFAARTWTPRHWWSAYTKLKTTS